MQDRNNLTASTRSRKLPGKSDGRLLPLNQLCPTRRMHAAQSKVLCGPV